MDDPMQDWDNWGWQATAMSMKERTSYLWKNNPIPFNVSFAVGPEGQKKVIGAHRDILAISSEVFYSMFYGPLTKPRDPNDPIGDDDIDPEAFRLMLKFIYTESIAHGDESKLWDCRIEPFPTGVELAFKTMQAAGKYGIPALYLFCRNYILDDIQKTFTTSDGVAEYGLLYALYVRNPEWNNKLIIEAVWREIDAFTEAALQVADQVLQTVDEAFMVEFLSRPSLNFSKDIMLYNFAVRWARLQQGGPQRHQTLKDVMENLCKVIRFLAMSEQEWLDGPVKDDFFTLDDLKYKAALVDSVAPRNVHDPPAIIKFEIFRAQKTQIDQEQTGEHRREDYSFQLEIQTQTEDNHVLTQLVEKCVRNQMERNGTDDIDDLIIDFLYKYRMLSYYCSGEIDLTKEELEMLRNGGRTGAQMKLGFGDVAVAFTLDSDRRDELSNVRLVFGDGTGKNYWKTRLRFDNSRLFYLGRLSTGQIFLDSWVPNSNRDRPTYLYDITHRKKTLGAPAKKRKTTY